MRNAAGKRDLVWCDVGSDVADASKSLDVQFWPPLCRFFETISGFRFKVRCFLFFIAEARNSFKFEAVFSFKIQYFWRFSVAVNAAYPHSFPTKNKQTILFTKNLTNL